MTRGPVRVQLIVVEEGKAHMLKIAAKLIKLDNRSAMGRFEMIDLET